MALAPDNNGRFDHWFEIVSSVFSAGLSYHKLEQFRKIGSLCRKRKILEVVSIILKINTNLLCVHLYAALYLRGNLRVHHADPGRRGL